MSKTNNAAYIFALAGMSKRYDYIAHTLCRNPDIEIAGSEKDIKNVLILMHAFAQLPTKSNTSSYYKALCFYIKLIKKIYDKQFLNVCDSDFFHNLIQKNSGSGGPVSGYITMLESMPHTAILKMKRTVGITKYPDLVYYAKLIIKESENKLYHDIIHVSPLKDTTQ